MCISLTEGESIMKNLSRYFIKNKLLSIIIGIMIMALGIYISVFFIEHKNLLISRILAIIVFTLGFTFFRFALSSPDGNLKITVFKSFILVCGIMVMSSISDAMKISTSWLRSSIIVITIFSLLNVLENKK